MGSNGRNFSWLQSPEREDRLGRYYAPASLLFGTPVHVIDDTGLDENGQLHLELAPSGTAPRKGLTGIIDWVSPTAMPLGFDARMTRPSDIDHCPDEVSVQLCAGPATRIRLTNTVASTFQHQRPYTGRVMLGGLGATPTVHVGDFLVPGDGNDVDGYWDAQTDDTDAWLIVLGVYDTGEVDAQFLF